MKRAVLFGGAGFIGSHLAGFLQKRGVSVLVADLVPPPVENIDYVRTDVRERIELDGDGIDVAFNLAAVHRTPGHPSHEYYDTNVGGALNVTEWCAQNGVSAICFTSSISVYGPSEAPKYEDSPLTPNTAYGRSKMLAEQIHRQWLNASSVRRLVTVRPAVVFGPGEHGNFTRLANALSRGRFAYPGRGDVVKACGYVGDLVRAMGFGLDSGERELTMNYAYPEAYTIKDICVAFQDVAGYNAPHMVPPGVTNATLRVLQALGGTGRASIAERARKLTASTNVKPETLRKMGFEWETDLRSGLRAWREASPTGEFI